METSQRLVCEASLVRMRHDAEGAVLDVGRMTRTIPPSICPHAYLELEELLPKRQNQGNEDHLAGTYDQQGEAARVFAKRAVDEQDAHETDERAPVSDHDLCRSAFDRVPEARAR